MLFFFYTKTTASRSHVHVVCHFMQWDSELQWMPSVFMTARVGPVRSVDFICAGCSILQDPFLLSLSISASQHLEFILQFLWCFYSLLQCVCVCQRSSSLVEDERILASYFHVNNEQWTIVNSELVFLSLSRSRWCWTQCELLGCGTRSSDEHCSPASDLSGSQEC